MTDTENDQTPPLTSAAERANTFPWPPLLLVAAIIASVGLSRLFPLSWPGVDDAPARIVGLGIGALGVVLIVASIITLRRHETTVLPDKAATALVTTGPYRFFRNPIYLGDVMMLFGLAELTKNVWFVIAAGLFAVLVTLLQILPEERHLEARFGDAYLNYKQRARRWI
jgi:protein-S-isoprenylcysteine O-methyltransferase Ste14